MRLNNDDLRLLHQVLYAIQLPRARTPRVLVYKMASLTNLVVVEEYTKLYMLRRLLFLDLKFPQPFSIMPMEMFV